MLNRIVLMGRLTEFPTLRNTNGGRTVANFSLAVDRNFLTDGRRETDFFDIVAWQSTAEFVEKYFGKGQLVCVEGRLQRRPWETKDGQKRYAFEVVADSVHFAGANKNEGQNGKNEFNDGFNDFDPFDEQAA